MQKTFSLTNILKVFFSVLLSAFLIFCCASEIVEAQDIKKSATQTEIEVTLVDSHIQTVGNYTSWKFVIDVVDENYSHIKAFIDKEDYNKIYSGEINNGDKCILSGLYSPEYCQFVDTASIELSPY